MKLYIDIGGTNLRSICDSFSDSISSSEIGLYSYIAKTLKQHPNIDGIGISYAGQVDNGVIYSAPNISIDEHNIASRIYSEFGVKLAIDNDLNCALLAEANYFKTQNIAVVYVGTGLGGSVMSRGEIIRGFRNSAFELGHIPFKRFDNIVCGCGRDNCVEISSSGSGLIKQLGYSSLDEARESDRGVYDNFIDGLLHACGVMVTLANPEVLVLGGGVVGANSYLADIVRENISNFALRANLKELKIHSSEISNGSLDGAKLLI